MHAGGREKVKWACASVCLVQFWKVAIGLYLYGSTVSSIFEIMRTVGTVLFLLALIRSIGLLWNWNIEWKRCPKRWWWSKEQVDFPFGYQDPSFVIWGRCHTINIVQIVFVIITISRTSMEFCRDTLSIVVERIVPWKHVLDLFGLWEEMVKGCSLHDFPGRSYSFIYLVCWKMFLTQQRVCGCKKETDMNWDCFIMVETGFHDVETVAEKDIIMLVGGDWMVGKLRQILEEGCW